MVKDGIWYGLGLGAVAAAVWYFTGDWKLIVPPLLLAAFFLWFFRDPNRSITSAPGAIVSPADGVITEAEWVETTQGSKLRVSIFLNVFDVHVNRSPIKGTVKVMEYREGGFMNAMTPESSLTNEQTLIQIDGGGYEVSLEADCRAAGSSHRMQPEGGRNGGARTAHRHDQVRLALRRADAGRGDAEGEDRFPGEGRSFGAGRTSDRHRGLMADDDRFAR